MKLADSDWATTAMPAAPKSLADRSNSRRHSFTLMLVDRMPRPFAVIPLADMSSVAIAESLISMFAMASQPASSRSLLLTSSDVTPTFRARAVDRVRMPSEPSAQPRSETWLMPMPLPRTSSWARSLIPEGPSGVCGESARSTLNTARTRASQSPREQQRNVGRRSGEERPNVWREKTLHAPLVLKYVGCGGSAQCDDASEGASSQGRPACVQPRGSRYQWR